MKKIWLGIMAAVFFLMPLRVNASELGEEKMLPQTEQEAQEVLWDEFELQEMDDILGDIFPNKKMNFRETITGIISGDLTFSIELVGRMVSDQFFYEFRNSKTGMVHILLIVIVASVFTNFSNVFQNRHISEISFYVLYLLLITISLNSFQILVSSASTSLEHLTSFMKILGPIYFLAVAFASGSTTSIMFYNLVLLLIYLVELVILNFLLPLVQVFIVIKVLNNLSSEEYLSKFAELLETVIAWTVKTLFGSVIGLNVIQGLLSPAIDSLKRSAVTRGAEAIPVIGDALGGVTEVMLGTTVLIKNGIGVAGALICVGICLVPIIQMGIITLLYQFIAAMIQPISDKRIVGCISSIAEGSKLLLRIIFTSGMLFLLTIAVVAATTTSH